MFLVDDRLWDIFVQTGNVEAYLLLKQVEQKKQEEDLQGKAYSEGQLED